MIDSHIHLSHKRFDQVFPFISFDENGYSIIQEGNRELLISKMKQEGISCAIEPAIDADSNEALLHLSRNTDGFVLPAVGNHPTRCIRSSLGDFSRVKEYARQKEVIAIGETGLDYHYKEKKEQHRLNQKIWFCWQIRLADKLKLPLILHIREADKDALSILQKRKNKLHGGVYHCFRSTPEVARKFIELGFCLGIGGSLLMEDRISEPIKQTLSDTNIPIDYILLETDSPEVRPQRPDEITGKKWSKARNTSLILPAIAAKIAEIKGMTVEEVARITENNTRRVFNI